MGKRILIHDYAGHPFQVQLSRELARRGYDILHLYFGNNNTPKGDLEKRVSDPRTLSMEGIYTKQPVQKYNYIKRWLQDLEYGNLLVARIKTFNPDFVLSANTPLEAQKKIMQACRMVGSKFIFWLQDLNGLASYRLLSRKIPILGNLIGCYHLQLERSMLQNSDRVVLISDDFKPIMEKWRVRQDLIKVIPNWAPLEDVPIREKINPWSIQKGISDKFCILYTGGLGLKHNPNLLLQLALHYQDRGDIRIVIVSEGTGSDWLRQKKDELGLANIMLVDYQPFTQIPDILASGDILVAILEPDAAVFSVPSKVLTYLCAKRPLLLAVPSDNLAAKIVIDNNAGLVVPPGDVDAFVGSAEKLANDETLCGKYSRNARLYAEQAFEIKKICDQFEDMFV